MLDTEKEFEDLIKQIKSLPEPHMSENDIKALYLIYSLFKIDFAFRSFLKICTIPYTESRTNGKLGLFVREIIEVCRKYTSCL
jgi:hypothetical protein